MSVESPTANNYLNINNDRLNKLNPVLNGMVSCPRDGCTAVFKPESLEEHENLVHNDAEGICNYCDQTILIRDWPTHIENCQTTQKGTRCSVEGCNVVIKRNHSLEHHMATAHSIHVPCTYDNCNARVQAAKLLAHVRDNHTSAYSTNCKNCGKDFPDSAISDHVRSCDLYKIGDKFVCTVRGCDQEFSTKYARNTHVYHTHEPPIPCPDQDCISVIKKRSLKVHLTSTHKQEFSRCRYCHHRVKTQKFLDHLKSCQAFQSTK